MHINSNKKKFWLDSIWISIFIIILIVINLCIIGFYLIPSQSMQPNLLAGDRILVNKLAYSLHLPFINKPILQWRDPKRGDIIIFSFANSDEFYIKRVIGLPGDFIKFNANQLIINDIAVNLTPQIKLNKKDLNFYWESNALLFLNGHAIYLESKPGQTFFETRRFLVPPNHVFVLGDNRDQSADSRTYGYVPIANIYAKVNMVLFSTTGEAFSPIFRRDRNFLKILH